MTELAFKKTLVAVDNSPFSAACAVAGVSVARTFGGEVVGAHVYAARMHERRFRQMEATLPDRYLVEEELDRQRTIHDSLITLGLQLISDCYLDDLERSCLEAEVPFTRKTFDGKNWEQLSKDINESGYDLVVLGARGHGTDRTDTVGSVCLRVIRSTRADVLVIKEPAAFEDGAGRGILVALDGSEESFGALGLAVALGKTYGRPVEAIAAFDPYFHYEVFHSMVEVLSPGAARVFKFKEQERLHEEIIDTGLARLYQTHLEAAKRIASAQGVELETGLLSGRAADEVLAHVADRNPWLLLVGRIGVHSGEEMDIGSVTEHLLRFASCNLLIASRRSKPPMDVWGDVSLRWTRDADAVLARVPAEHRGAVRLMVHRLAAERGHTVVTRSLVGEAAGVLRPRPEGMQQMGRAALAVAAEAVLDERAAVYLCRKCGRAASGERPVACPVCAASGDEFLAVEPDEIEAAVQAEGGSRPEATFDGRSLRWTDAALRIVADIGAARARERARRRIEKAALLSKLPVVTVELVRRYLPMDGSP